VSLRHSLLASRRYSQGFEPVLPWFADRPHAGLKERPIICFCGKRGSFKTYSAAVLCINRMREGEMVLSNTALIDPLTGQRAGRLTSWKQIIDPDTGFVLKDATVFIDEAPLWLDTRFWQKTPAYVRAYWRQSRKHNIGFVLTAQSFGDVEKNMRDLLDYVVLCERIRWVPKRVTWCKQRIALPEEFRLIENGIQDPQQRIEARIKRLPAWGKACYDTSAFVHVNEWGDPSDGSSTVGL